MDPAAGGVAGTAADGRAAIRQARELLPDICLLDLEMPVLGGLDALPAIRAVCDAAVVIRSRQIPAIQICSLRICFSYWFVRNL